MPQGIKSSYGNTTIVDRSMVEDLAFVSPQEYPLLHMITGGALENPTLDSLSTVCQETKYEWLEDEDLPRTWTGLVTTDGATAFGVSVNLYVPVGALMANGDLVDQYISEDTIIRIDGFIAGPTAAFEMVRVTNVNTTTHVMTVSRNWNGLGTQTFLSTSGTFTIVASAHREGTDVPTPINFFPSPKFNYVQESVMSFSLTEIEQAIKRYGIVDAIEYEARKRMREITKMYNRACYYGTRTLSTASVPGAYGNIATFLDSTLSTDQAAAALTTNMVHSALQNIVNFVGTTRAPKVLVAGPWIRRRLTVLFSTTSLTAYQDASSRTAGLKVEEIVTDFGNLQVVLDPDCPPGELYGLNTDMMGFGPLQGKGLRRIMLAKTGTADKYAVAGNYTFEMRGSRCHFRLTNLSLTS